MIAMRHKEEMAEFYFATFIETIVSKFSRWWYEEAHSYFFKILEKVLWKSRILVLKIENFLFRKVRAVRDISERNGSDH